MILVDVTKETPTVEKKVDVRTIAKKLGCRNSELNNDSVVVLFYRDSDLTGEFGRWRPVRAIIK